MPQIGGGELPFPVTVNVSVRHSVAKLAGAPTSNNLKNQELKIIMQN